MNQIAWLRAAETYAYRLATGTECRCVLAELGREIEKAASGNGDRITKSRQVDDLQMLALAVELRLMEIEAAL